MQQLEQLHRDWAARSAELASWAMRFVVNRDDVYGHYLHLGKIETAHRQLTDEILRNHFAATNRSHLIGVHAIDAEGNCKWIAIDVDQHATSNPEISLANWQFVMYTMQQLANYGLRPLVTDSNGRGGFHVRIIFADPISSLDAHDFGRFLVRDWSSFGLCQQPEVYPKQPRLDNRLKYGNWLRLPGHHHTYDQYTSVWNGNGWLTGESAVTALLANDYLNRIPIPTQALIHVRDGDSRTEICPRSTGRPIEQVLNRLVQVTPSSNPNQWRSCCPAHADSHPSLSISETECGTVLLHCFVGCTFSQILDALGLQARELFPASDPGSPPVMPHPASVIQPATDWNHVAQMFRESLTPARLDQLSARLGVSIESLSKLCVGWDLESRAYTFPECDETGQVVGILLRSPNGEKWLMRGGRRGLIIPNCAISDGPIFLPEGASDVAALLDYHANAIGRPSANTNCLEKLVTLLSRTTQDVFVVGERDGPVLAESPGYIGAARLATQLRNRLGPRVKLTLPPERNKDVRAWLSSRQQWSSAPAQ